MAKMAIAGLQNASAGRRKLADKDATYCGSALICRRIAISKSSMVPQAFAISVLAAFRKQRKSKAEPELKA
jgi:hypothetical protein